MTYHTSLAFPRTLILKGGVDIHYPTMRRETSDEQERRAVYPLETLMNLDNLFLFFLRDAVR
jgi:hypothetical protein